MEAQSPKGYAGCHCRKFETELKNIEIAREEHKLLDSALPNLGLHCHYAA